MKHPDVIDSLIDVLQISMVRLLPRAAHIIEATAAMTLLDYLLMK